MIFLPSELEGRVIPDPNPKSLFKVNPKPDLNQTKKNSQPETRPHPLVLEPEVKEKSSIF